MPAITADFFPPIVVDRAGPATGGTGAPGAPAIHIPRTRILNFVVSCAASTRSTISSPVLRGPAVIKSIFLEGNAGADPPGHSLELGYNDTPVTEENVSTTLAKPWTALSEKIDEAAPIVSGVHQGFIQWSLFNTRPRAPWPLNQLITLSQFNLVFSAAATALAAIQYVGWVEVIEDVEREALAGFR